MKNLLMILPVLALIACAPARGTPPIVYIGTSADILATAAQICPALRPDSMHNYMSVRAITPTAVTCAADETTGWKIVDALGGSNSSESGVIITALQNGASTSVAISGTDQNLSNAVFAELDKKFQRVQVP
ncbi:hypothetical protein [Deinococcus sonorensis]|uniref:Lipoprotein n=2 Tax=Deinococcus sonorensis TaxID=309891 RepID=A0AAU7U757_9DEIO